MSEQVKLVSAIQLLQRTIRWKPQKAKQHLQTRIAHGHLPPAATLSDYEAVIRASIEDPFAEVYIYAWKAINYPTIVSQQEGVIWLVMFSVDGIMETAFPPTFVDQYLADPRFQYVGTLQEVLS